VPRLDAGASGKIVAGVRPEHVVVGATENAAVVFDTTVERVEQLGATTFAYCVLPNGERLTVQSAGQAAHAPGDALRVAVPLAHLHVFDADDGRSLIPRP
jgi:lactose/L-arabinose transport system ATP-binding protein